MEEEILREKYGEESVLGYLQTTAFMISNSWCKEEASEAAVGFRNTAREQLRSFLSLARERGIPSEKIDQALGVGVRMGAVGPQEVFK